MQRKGITRFEKYKSTEKVIINVKVEGSSKKCVCVCVCVCVCLCVCVSVCNAWTAVML